MPRDEFSEAQRQAVSDSALLCFALFFLLLFISLLFVTRIFIPSLPLRSNVVLSASNAVTPGRSASLLTRLGASKDGYPYDEVAGKLPLFGREAELKSVAKIGERMSKEQYTQHIQTLYRRILRGGFDWANLDTDMAYRNWANDVRQEFEKYRNAEPGLAQQQILKASELIVCYFSKHPLPYKSTSVSIVPLACVWFLTAFSDIVHAVVRRGVRAVRFSWLPEIIIRIIRTLKSVATNVRLRHPLLCIIFLSFTCSASFLARTLDTLDLYKYGGGAFQRNVPPPLGLAEPPSPYIEHDAPAKSDQHH